MGLHAVLVEGPAGIGKSRLLAEARLLGEKHELTVCSARGGELERDFPFGVVRQLFESQLVTESERSRLLAGPAQGAGPVFGEGVRSDEPLDEGMFARLHGLYWLTLNLSAERPLLLAVDDLHWCDGASLRFLAYLARHLEDISVVLVASLRSSEADANQAILEELMREPHAQVLLPGPLTADAAAESSATEWVKRLMRLSRRHVIRRPAATLFFSASSSRHSWQIASRHTPLTSMS